MNEDLPEYVTDEPEGWPYDGTVHTLRRIATGALVLGSERRHIDADRHRYERRELTAEEAASWLIEQGASIWEFARLAPEAIAAAETILEAADQRPAVRRLGSKVYFSEQTVDEAQWPDEDTSVRSWLTLDEARAHLRQAGVDPETVRARCPD